MPAADSIRDPTSCTPIRWEPSSAFRAKHERSSGERLTIAWAGGIRPIRAQSSARVMSSVCDFTRKGRLGHDTGSAHRGFGSFQGAASRDQPLRRKRVAVGDPCRNAPRLTISCVSRPCQAMLLGPANLPVVQEQGPQFRVAGRSARPECSLRCCRQSLRLAGKVNRVDQAIKKMSERSDRAARVSCKCCHVITSELLLLTLASCCGATRAYCAR